MGSEKDSEAAKEQEVPERAGGAGKRPVFIRRFGGREMSEAVS